MIFLQTETQPDAIKSLFNHHDPLYEASEIKVLLPHNQGGFLVHSLILFPKCLVVARMMSGGFKEAAQKNVWDLSKETTAPEHIITFLRLLYGYRIRISFSDLLEVFLFADRQGYKSSGTMRDSLLGILDYEDVEAISNLLTYPQFPLDIFVTKIPLNKFRALSEVITDLDTLRMLLAESIRRYGKDTKSLKVYAETKTQDVPPETDALASLLNLLHREKP